ncbi:tyrosine-type recombinase/integrase [Aquirufa antheringensis]|uniref:Tyrosine recombinase XerC n=2 Tax=Aquirufa antheringensis TaxID=2516559 RepID=A0A4Q9B8H7_9BACT|nr:tyrosine-type recombinase/integrase [Aquirufa antheringensis]MCZ2485781.1 tyrosine-type recombinase/integrase [Aquirufa antheringensis]MCZ2486527.1 tyrosine-type recombinase/integrase [Aquirufa antheringensis]MCZ2488692.1 tyrosine-type recombinase/integrase [Aquirufa antheringensis]TBH71236.1 integrase [Aquirufa antheringensis]
MNRELVIFFLDHLSIERRLSSHTITSYSTDLEQFSAFIAPTELSQVQALTIRKWLISLSDDSLQNRSINRKLATLRTFYKYLLRTGKIAENPMTSIRMVKTTKKIPQFVRESEMENLVNNRKIAMNFSEARDELILFLLYGTGIRLAELISLQNNQVNLAAKTIRVIGKRNKERMIPIPGLLVDLIATYRSFCTVEHAHLLLTDKGEPLYPMFVQRLVKKNLGEYSQLEKLSPHVLRHTYATHLLNKGADLNAIKELLGHANLAATQVYTHNSMEKMKAIYLQAHPKA